MTTDAAQAKADELYRGGWLVGGYVDEIAEALDVYAAEQTAALRAEVERLRAALVFIERVTDHHDKSRDSRPGFPTTLLQDVWTMAHQAILAAPEGHAVNPKPERT